jgi:hypothetical protein
MDLDGRRRVFEDVVRLRRAERVSPSAQELGAVRLHLEGMLGDAVSISFAAQMLGVSHPALRRWVESGDVPFVITPRGRRAIPVGALAGIFEALENHRRNGRVHALEAVVKETSERADRLPSGALLPEERDDADAGRRSELRSLAYHRAIARRLDRSTADMALALIRYWRDQGSVDPRYAGEWEQLLEGPLPSVRKVLEEDSQRAHDLRQNSPFAGLLSEAERRRIAAEVD